MDLEMQLKAWKTKLAELPEDDEHAHERDIVAKQISRLEAHLREGVDDGIRSFAGGRAPRDDDTKLMLARFAKAKALAVVDQVSVEKAVRKLYGPTLGDRVLKAADLVVSDDVPTARGVADFVELLRADSLYDKLSFRQISPYVPVAVQTVAAQAAFVGEGQTASASRWEATTIVLEPKKLVSLVPATIESIRDSSIQADRELTRDMLGAIANTTDSVMFGTSDATAHAPRGLLYGISPVVSAGPDVEDVEADVKGLIARIDPLLVGGVQLVMNPLLAFHVGLLRSELGSRAFPGIGINGGELEGVPVVVSNAIQMGTIIAIVPSEIFTIGDRGVEIAISRDATVDGSSAFQDYFLAFRAVRPVSWAFRRANTIAYLTGAEYGATASPTAS